MSPLTTRPNPAHHWASHDWLDGEALAARADTAIGYALRQLRVTVTRPERDDLSQSLVLLALERMGERHPNLGSVHVSDGAASVTALTYHALHLVARDPEWHDVADAASVRERARGERRTDAADPLTLDATDAPDAPGFLAAAVIRANVERDRRNPERVTAPGEALAHLDALAEALARRADWTDADKRRVRLALAVALDERDPDAALTDAAPGMALRSAVERMREGRKLVRQFPPSVIARTLTDVAGMVPADEPPTRARTAGMIARPVALAVAAIDAAPTRALKVCAYMRECDRMLARRFCEAAPRAVPPRPLPNAAADAAALIDAVAEAHGGRTGAKSHAASMTPRERTAQDGGRITAWQGSGTAAASVIRYIDAVERASGESAKRDGRISRLAERRDVNARRLALRHPSAH